MKTRFYLSCVAALAGSLGVSGCYDPYYTYTGRGEVTAGAYYRPGHVVHELPGGYDTVIVDDTRYYYHDGIYYRPRGGSYVVVERPGRDIVYRDRDRDRIPDRYERRGNRNDRWNDVTDRYGSRRTRDFDRDRIPNRYDRRSYDREEVRIIRDLPRNSRIVDYRGTRYYRVDDNFYRPRGDVYILVDPPF